MFKCLINLCISFFPRFTEPFGRSLLLIESTPLWKDPESTFGKGKRPGETTLKKELWNKFEAASYGFRLKGFEGLDSDKKGFLDRLDEASMDAKSPAADIPC